MHDRRTDNSPLPPSVVARRQLLDLYGEMIEHADTIDFDAPEEEFVAQLKANRVFEDSLQPAVDEARARIRRADVLARGPQRRPSALASVPRARARTRAPRRNVRSQRQRARAPASSSEDSEPPLALAVAATTATRWLGLDVASARMLEHERRRWAARRLAA
jgi:hypothetical protein